MRTIIAGSRTISDVAELELAIKNSGFVITEVISGGAQGVDSLGIAWANANALPLTIVMAEWDVHGKAAGPIRNAEMAEIADALILVWDGLSRGSGDMLSRAVAKGLKIHSHIVKKEEEQ
jgi:hypothetical protein